MFLIGRTTFSLLRSQVRWPLDYYKHRAPTELGFVWPCAYVAILVCGLRPRFQTSACSASSAVKNHFNRGAAEDACDHLAFPISCTSNLPAQEQINEQASRTNRLVLLRLGEFRFLHNRNHCFPRALS